MENEGVGTYQLVKVVRRVGENVGLNVEERKVLEDDLLKLRALLGRVGVVEAHNHLALVLVRKVLCGAKGRRRPGVSVAHARARAVGGKKRAKDRPPTGGARAGMSAHLSSLLDAPR